MHMDIYTYLDVWGSFDAFWNTNCDEGFEEIWEKIGEGERSRRMWDSGGP